MRCVWSCVVFVAVFGLTAAHAQTPVALAGKPTDLEAPTVTARLLATEARVGDTVSMVVTTVSPDRVPVNLPANLDLAPFELVDRSETEKTLGDGKRQRQFTFRIAAFETGLLTVPAVSLTYLASQGAVRTVSTEPLPITIKSLLANEPDPTAKPDAPPVAVMEELRWPLYVAGGLLAAILGALVGSVLLSRWRRRAKVVYVPPPRPPHEVALEKLKRLESQLGTEADLRQFYFQVSETLREYFGGRYGFESLELTTDELLVELKRVYPFLLSDVEGWLSSCDLVKFARVSPTLDEAREALQAGTKFVTTTVPPPEPVATVQIEGAAHE